ncbi:hypothetical protein I4U23_011232 [Adineta vaga]|nr:hypothetical protein I4U23_011232 [Adineta vaga]
MRHIFSDYKSYLLKLNLYETGIQDETTIKNERRSTRLYLVLLIISMIIFIFYGSLKSYTKSIVIQSPSLTEYHRIKEETSLQCPCSNLAIKYKTFTEIEPLYHELCQSDFVKDEWINHLFQLYEESWNNSIQIDFRRIGTFQFQTLRSLCELAKDTINKSLQSFGYTDFIQPQLILPVTFEDQIGSLINGFIRETPKAFVRTLHFMQDITAQSLFMTGASITSVRPIIPYGTYKMVMPNGISPPYQIPRYDGIVPYPGINYTFKNGFTCVCSSSTATTCMGLTTFDNNIVPGFQTGCYMLSALMNSTLEAFYNQTFIDNLSSSSRTFEKLNSSNPHWRVDKLLGQLFVQSWSNKTYYDKYYKSCAPESCSYKNIQHNNFWDILLLLIGSFQGLSMVLTVVSPIFILKIWPIIRSKVCQRTFRDSQVAAVQAMPGN